MNQPVSENTNVTHHLGAIIGLFTLVAINLACIGNLFWVVVTGGPVRMRLGVKQVTTHRT